MGSPAASAAALACALTRAPLGRWRSAASKAWASLSGTRNCRTILPPSRPGTEVPLPARSPRNAGAMVRLLIGVGMPANPEMPGSAAGDPGVADLGAVDERAVAGAQIPHLDAGVVTRQRGMAPRDRWVEHGDVARERATDHLCHPRSQIEGLLAFDTGQGIEH